MRHPFVRPHRIWIVVRPWCLAIAGALLAFGLSGRAPALAAEHARAHPPAANVSGPPASQGQHGQQGAAGTRAGLDPPGRQAQPAAHVHPHALPPGSPPPAPLPPIHAPLAPPGPAGHAPVVPPGHASLVPPGPASLVPPGPASLVPPGPASSVPPGHASFVPLPAPAASPLRPGAVGGTHTGRPMMPSRALALGWPSRGFRLLLLGSPRQGEVAVLEPPLEPSESAWGGCPPSVPGGTMSSRVSAAAVFLAGLGERVHLPASSGRLPHTDERWSAIARALRLDRPG